ncbi:class I SAM-dependent RNA methyltransferase [Actinoplanes derwentensis]|uniref:tRNA/tmRNA/rRNA uracil-C5-methylase, TrmA/RlmC/RlmD family n=1 Tax=Actinoplanes derwentensis TaxID=113562 RepID=A0A1H2D5Q5_9ACTN|nr:TRAM domain-containing protein [Actinoplanes derwentensis]GID85670.1 putative RNA methyltransferase [Actinoplanes derwentensis]SDT78080.1 tRNA/tmRNA/rRNA uracil-C5-methylase, TrmA/RlmC/RlmD family [Actinoplanes derwentensis]
MTVRIDDELVEGDRVEVTVGAPAHGGHCVARIGGAGGRVVFVRHALPGERVTAEITELHRGWLRADAVEIHEASPDRVTPPCAFAHPGGCGGCDLQHASGDAQLRWKTAVVREQLTRLAGLSEQEQDQIFVRVEPLPSRPARSGFPAAPKTPAASETGPESPADPAAAGFGHVPETLLGWRSRVRYAIDAAGRPGLLQHRSNQVVPIDRCVIAHPAIQDLDVLANDWPTVDAVQAVATTGGDVAVLARPSGSTAPEPGDDLSEAAEAGLIRLTGPTEVIEQAAGRVWRVPPQGFWQVHPAAADTLVGAVLEMLRPEPGEVCWDLYGGAGLFAAALAERTGARTVVVESSPTGVTAARNNLANLAGTEIVEARVDLALARRRLTAPVDLVVLDPPRAGAGARVVRSIAAAKPRAIAYVACDPAALARDLKTFRAEGWRIESLRAFDCFPMTQHVECVAHLVPA